MFPNSHLVAQGLEALRRYRQRRADAKVALLVADLPHHLQKDIGWPAAYRRQRGV